MVLLAVPPGASATGPGTPGKVVSVQYGQPVQLWDPVAAEEQAGAPGAGLTTLVDKGYPAGDEFTFSLITRPQWSRDGMKVAFTASAPDPGDDWVTGGPLQQVSIWVYTVSTGALTRVTEPPAGMRDPSTEDSEDLGHWASDYAPTWSPDGSAIAFIRHVIAGQHDPWEPDDGIQVWTVPSSGGTAQRLTQQEDYSLTGLQWIADDELLATTSDEVVRISTAGGALTPVSGTEGIGVQGLDVSPDGSKFSYIDFDGLANLNAHVFPTSGGPAVASFPTATAVTYSPTGDGVLSLGCAGEAGDQCGLIETYVPEGPGDRDTLENETARLALAMYPSGLFDVQPQELPVVFLPGFLGSVIECGSDNLWPGGFLTLPQPLEMQLAADGLTNAGCSGTRASGEAVDTVAFQDIYDTVESYVSDKFGSRGLVLGWDWRKRPHETIEELDDRIDALLAAPGLGRDQGVGRVVLWGHSYGGLLIRTYMEWRPARVARALTVGTPYWGSPKAIFPLAFGIETPIEKPGLDLFFANASLKQLAVNLAGLYQLYPSSRFPSWLSVNGVAATTSQVVSDLGGNTALLEQAQGYHAADYEGFYDNGGKIDVRAVVGTGLASIGAVDLRPRADGTDAVGIGWVNGDGTVPNVSARQEPTGTGDPLGARIHLQSRCRVEHVALANDEQVLDAYGDWLEDGSVPAKLPAPCVFRAGKLEFEPGEIGPEPARAERRVARTTAGTFNLTEADAKDLAQILAFDDRVMVVTDHAQPFTLRLRLQDATFTYTPLSEDGDGAVQEYGPVSGVVDITSATDPAGAPTVTVDGVTLQPHAPTSPQDAPPGASGDAPAGGATPAAGAAPSVAAPVIPKVERLRILGRPSLRGRRLTVKVAVPAAGVLRASVKLKRRTLATSRKSVRRKSTVTLRLKLRRKPRGPVRATLTFSPKRGAVLKTAITVRPRR